jgi:hypothetical protein
MTEHGHISDRGTFICRIDGRAGYLRLWDDRLELIRSGRRGPEAVGPEVIPLHLITRVSTGKPGRMLTAIELVAAGGFVELKMPTIDAPRVAELLSLLVSQAPMPAAVESHVLPAQIAEPAEYAPVEYAPVEDAPGDSVMADFVMPDFSMKVEMPEWTPLAEDDATPATAPVDLAEIVAQREYVVAEVEMPQWTPLPTIDALDEVDEVLLRNLESPAALADPAGLAIPKVDMPQWTPLPETDQPDAEMPEMVLSQIVLDELSTAAEVDAVASTEPVTEIEPLPEGSVLAAAAALAELENMLNDIPAVPAGAVVHADDEMVAEAREIFSLTGPAPDGSDGASIPTQPSEAVLTLAAAALLGGARSAVEETPEATPEPAPKLERPADLPPDLQRRLTGLDVLRDAGIMSDEDFAAAEAELLESAWSSAQTA